MQCKQCHPCTGTKSSLQLRLCLLRKSLTNIYLFLSLPICFLYSLLSLCSPTTSTHCSAHLLSAAERGQPNNSTPNNGKYAATASFTAGWQHYRKHRSSWGRGRRPTVHCHFTAELGLQQIFISHISWLWDATKIRTYMNSISLWYKVASYA